MGHSGRADGNRFPGGPVEEVLSRVRQFLANPYKGRALVHRVLRRVERACLARRLNLPARRPLGELIALKGGAAEHFRRRSTPAFFFSGRDFQGIRRRVSAEELERCLNAAEKYSSLTFEFRSRPPVTFHGSIDWRHLEAEDPDWNADLHRLDWLVTLVL